MESAGLEPALRECKSRVLPLNDDPGRERQTVELAGFEPAFPACDASVLPLDDNPEQRHRGGGASGSRTRVHGVRGRLPGPASRWGQVRERGPSAGVEPAPSCLEDSRPSVGRRGLIERKENVAGEPAGNRTRQPGFADQSAYPEIRLRGAVKENRTPVASLARSHSTIELPPHERRAA